MRVPGTQPAIDRLLEFVGIFPRVTSTTDENGVLWVSDGRERLAVASPHRALRLRHGIARRRNRLIRQYLPKGLIPISRGDVILNIGANIGEVAIDLAERGARVIAMEPDPNVTPALQANAEARPQIEVVSAAAWSEDGPLTLYLATDGANTSFLPVSDASVVVPAARLDTIVAARAIDHVRLIVGNTEGAEPEALEGAVETLKRTDYVSLDCGYERGTERTLEACEAILVAAGFGIIHRSPRNNMIARNARLPG